MNSKIDRLSDLDIEKIRQLVEVLEKSTFDHLTLELDDFRLTVGTGAPETGQETRTVAGIAPSVGARASAPVAAPALPTAKPVIAAAAEGLIDVTAPTMGHFYARPDPNSEPFVGLGSRVGRESTVGLLEIMKLFNSVTAGIDGVVDQICVADAELVEYGQVLMRVRPAA